MTVGLDVISSEPPFAEQHVQFTTVPMLNL